MRQKDVCLVIFTTTFYRFLLESTPPDVVQKLGLSAKGLWGSRVKAWKKEGRGEEEEGSSNADGGKEGGGRVRGK